MADFSWEQIEASKRSRRGDLADLPPAAKLRLLDELRERRRQILAAVRDAT